MYLKKYDPDRDIITDVPVTGRYSKLINELLSYDTVTNVVVETIEGDTFIYTQRENK